MVREHWRGLLKDVGDSKEGLEKQEVALYWMLLERGEIQQIGVSEILAQELERAKWGQRCHW